MYKKGEDQLWTARPLPPQRAPQPVPLYDELAPVYNVVEAGPLTKLEMKQNPSYQASDMKRKENSSYGPARC